MEAISENLYGIRIDTFEFSDHQKELDQMIHLQMKYFLNNINKDFNFFD